MRKDVVSLVLQLLLVAMLAFIGWELHDLNRHMRKSGGVVNLN